MHCCTWQHSFASPTVMASGITSVLGTILPTLKSRAFKFSCQRGVQQLAQTWRTRRRFVFFCSLCLCLCLCLQTQTSQEAPTLATFSAFASDCTESRGLLVAQALLQLTAKLVQQANFLTHCGRQHAASLYRLM